MCFYRSSMYDSWIEVLSYSVSLRSRIKRFEFILEHINKFNRAIKILDVGGTAEYWIAMNFMPINGTTITLLNLFPQTDVPLQFSSLVGDARDLSDFPDKSFDFVLSNSVINLLTKEDQIKMAKEIQRVGQTYIVQCPNIRFPIDWRTRMPFFHYLPADVQAWCFYHFRVGSYSRTKDKVKAKWLAYRVYDLSVYELSKLFAGAQIYKERWFGFTKSIAAYNFAETKCDI